MAAQSGSFTKGKNTTDITELATTIFIRHVKKLVLHFLLHSSGPDQGAGGSPGTVSAECRSSPSAHAPIFPSAPFPAAPVRAAVSVPPLSEYSAQCTSAAPAPAEKKCLILVSQSVIIIHFRIKRLQRYSS